MLNPAETDLKQGIDLKRPMIKYKRILLKLSGESLQGSSRSTNINPSMLEQYCDEIKAVAEEGVEIAIVIGGGNIFRGGQAETLGIDRVQGD